jgi:hypothetical protein
MTRTDNVEAGAGRLVHEKTGQIPQMHLGATGVVGRD